MKIFNLPDLGEGLPDAEIHEWHVKVGDTIKADAPLVSVETAKAVVDVPAPLSGIVAKLYGQAGDIIKTGAPLIAFEGEADLTSSASHTADAGTVVGNIQSNNDILTESATGIRSSKTPLHQTRTSTNKCVITPPIRSLARKLNVNLDSIVPTGPNQLLTTKDVLQAAQKQKTLHPEQALLADATPLRGVRRAMAISMAQSHQYIVPVTLVDDADIHAWKKGTDLTARLVRALVKATSIEPMLNALFDSQQLAIKPMQAVNVGLAMDSKDGLFVPVLKDAANLSAKQIREKIDIFKQQVSERAIPSGDLQGATISLSNFGTFAGRYANPIIVPPAIAILGAGRFRMQVVLNDKGECENHRILPLSLTFDHRAATGGEASRFLGAVITDLQSPT